MKRVFLLASLLLIPHAAAFVEGFEDYTTPPYLPTGDLPYEWLIHQDGGTIRTRDNASASGDYSLYFDRTTATTPLNVVSMTTDGTDQCGFSFSMMIPAPSDTELEIGVTESDTAGLGQANFNAVWIEMAATTNTVTGHVWDRTGNTDEAVAFDPPLTLSPGTWYTFTATCTGASNGNPYMNDVLYEELTTGAFGVIINQNFTTPWVEGTGRHMDRFMVYHGNTGQACNGAAQCDFHLDDVALNGAITFANADATITATGIVEFDVDVNGDKLLARHTNGQTAQIYSAQTGDSGATLGTPDCTKARGVLIKLGYSLVVDCEPTTGDANSIHIRDTGLGLMAFVDCSSDACQDEITENTAGLYDTNLPDDMGHIGDIHVVDDTYWYNIIRGSGGLTTDRAWTAFTYADGDTSGLVGVTAVELRDNGEDWTRRAAVVYDASSSPQINQLCSWRYQDRTFVAAASPNAATRIYEADVDHDNTRFKPDTIQPQFSLWSSTPVAATNALGMGCAQDKLLALTSSKAVMIQTTGADKGKTVWSANAEGVERSAVISGDGKFVAHAHNATHAVIRNATDGSAVSYLPRPTGSMTGMAMDYTAQNLWMGNATTIVRYSIFSATTGEEVPSNVDEDGVTLNGTAGATAADDAGLLGDSANTFADGFGISIGGANMFLGSIFVFGMMTGGATLFRESRLIGGIAGGVLGLVLAWSLGFISNSVMFVLVVLTIGSIAAWLWGRRE